MALAGQHILLTPDNIELPKQGLRELKQLLTKNSGMLFEDKNIIVVYYLPQNISQVWCF